jgi:hypothetical protein
VVFGECRRAVHQARQLDDAGNVFQVADGGIEPPHTLTAAQEARLRELGWKVGEGNFYQEWFASDDEERQEVAETVMQTFVDVYHISPTQPIEIIVNLE